MPGWTRLPVILCLLCACPAAAGHGADAHGLNTTGALSGPGAPRPDPSPGISGGSTETLPLRGSALHIPRIVGHDPRSFAGAGGTKSEERRALLPDPAVLLLLFLGMAAEAHRRKTPTPRCENPLWPHPHLPASSA